jgi:alkylresorcinol/alkylpyrone synthase
MLDPVSLLSLATAVPPHVLEQREVARRMLAAFGSCFERNPQLSDIFVNAGIVRRYSVRPIEWIEQPHHWGERGAAYLEGAGELFVAAAASALERAGLSGRDIDVIVSVTSSGIATPSLDARVGPALGLRPDVSRVPLFGLGCAGGATGLAIAARLARAHPGHKVLLVAGSSTRSPSAGIAEPRPISSPPPCSGMAPQRPCSKPDRNPGLSHALAQAPNIPGLTPST